LEGGGFSEQAGKNMIGLAYMTGWVNLYVPGWAGLAFWSGEGERVGS
jgi:hypothetical protein